MPEMELAISRPQRWNEPFGEMTERAVDQLLQIEPFCSINGSAFPPSLPLRGILAGDTRIVRYERGDVVVREGEYGNSAFLILSGTVRVVLERLDPTLLGREEQPQRGWLKAIAKLWQNPTLPEVRTKAAVTGTTGGTSIRDDAGTARVFVQDVPRLLAHTGTAQLSVGEIFGEVAAMSRTPRTATVLADERATLLEIRWQGLRDLMRRTPAIREHVERLYRQNSLRVHLRETELLKELPAPQLDVVAAATEFESYGNFDWYTDFGAHQRRDAAEQIAAEPLIAAEGDRPTGLYLIRSGFARVSHRHGHGHRTLAYIGKGQVFGLAELAHAFKTGAEAPWQNSLRAVGYVDVLRIPGDVVMSAVLPNVSSRNADSRLRTEETDSQSETRNPESEIKSSMLDFLADHRFLNGTQTMLIDLDRCTRCDDCVRACATTHDNNPRFIRQGPTHDHIMVANACMHCVDPVCMIGCPTGAIARDGETGTVRINDRTCIGCSTCANSCPYSAIRMVEIREPGGAFYVDEATQQPILKATKCDFCAGQLAGPACQAACPHDALIRIDMGNLSALDQWMAR
ncbi:MAG TPA: cyclic nucleotide-binding domain-containing protein [Lacipirellulaceae bacterium]|jgi:Fe-S-cluster-containing dehydrogenase component/CRP-like cAMP-binding protein|nr:cyclic nucleotide-binding domain-containing protein [Lacipirellulaceae bacterium]